MQIWHRMTCTRNKGFGFGIKVRWLELISTSSTARNRFGHLVELHLHQPVDVHILTKTFKVARDLCVTNGIVFVSVWHSFFHRWVVLVCHGRVQGQFFGTTHSVFTSLSSTSWESKKLIQLNSLLALIMSWVKQCQFVLGWSRHNPKAMGKTQLLVFLFFSPSFFSGSLHLWFIFFCLSLQSTCMQHILEKMNCK